MADPYESNIAEYSAIDCEQFTSFSSDIPTIGPTEQPARGFIVTDPGLGSLTIATTAAGVGRLLDANAIAGIFIPCQLKDIVAAGTDIGAIIVFY